jgi:hypothetical protein
MTALNVQPDRQLSATFMKAFGYAGKLARVKEIYEGLLATSTTPPSVWHYNALLFSYARKAEWEAAVHLYKCVTAPAAACLFALPSSQQMYCCSCSLHANKMWLAASCFTALYLMHVHTVDMAIAGSPHC